MGEAWRAPSNATTTPVVAGPAVVTGDGDTVSGHDAETGAVAWSYRRDLTLCAVGAGFPGSDDGDEQSVRPCPAEPGPLASAPGLRGRSS